MTPADRQRLLFTMAMHADKPLTQELASAILAAMDDDLSIPPSTFRTEVWQGFTFQAERVATTLRELAPLHDAYHRETRTRETAPDFDVARLLEAERAGTLLMFTARSLAGELVGVMRVRIGWTLEDQRLTAGDDFFFVKPERRGGLLAVRLWQFMERECFRFGVVEATFRSLHVSNAPAMARYLGYRPLGTIFHKVAQDGGDYSTVPTRHKQGVANDPVV